MPIPVSFDVFDTVLVRRVTEPSSVFLLLGYALRPQLGDTLSPEVFARSRLDAGRRAKRRAGTKDPSLVDIYREFVSSRPAPDLDHNLLVEAELAMEAKLLRPNTPVMGLVNAYRDEGRRVVFVSDTHLPSTFVREQLLRFGVAKPEDTIYTSCEAGATKRDGTLLPQVVRLEVDPDTRIVHHGDDLVADVDASRAARQVARHITNALPNRYETLLEVGRWDTGGLTSVFAGASRGARLDLPFSSTRETAIRDVVAGVACPLLVGYVLWVLRTAQRSGLRRLHFLSREGQVLKHIADRLLSDLQMTLDTNYLLVSRRSLNLAAAGRGKAHELAWVLTHLELDSVRAALERLGLQPDDLGSTLTDFGFHRSQWNEPLGSAGARRLRVLLSKGHVAQQLTARAARQRGQAIPYLREAGWFDPEPAGIVDVSGVGSQFWALNVLRTQQGCARGVGFLALRSKGEALEEAGGYRHADAPPISAYLEDKVSSLGHGFTPGLVQLLEVFAVADHGTVTGYGSRDDETRVALRTPDNRELQSWGLRTIRRTVDAFLDNLHLDPATMDLDADVRVASRRVVAEFWQNPTASEAEIWSTFPFEGGSGATDESSSTLAARIGPSELVARLFQQDSDISRWFEWSAGSESMSAPQVRALLSTARFGRRVASRLRR